MTLKNYLWAASDCKRPMRPLKDLMHAFDTLPRIQNLTPSLLMNITNVLVALNPCVSASTFPMKTILPANPLTTSGSMNMYVSNLLGSRAT